MDEESIKDSLDVWLLKDDGLWMNTSGKVWVDEEAELMDQYELEREMLRRKMKEHEIMHREWKNLKKYEAAVKRHDSSAPSVSDTPEYQKGVADASARLAPLWDIAQKALRDGTFCQSPRLEKYGPCGHCEGCETHEELRRVISDLSGK